MPQIVRQVRATLRAELIRTSGTILYLGCRSRSADFYYALEWAQYEDLGLQVRVAASRDQAEKVYVQHVIRGDKNMIKTWLYDRRGYMFVSGYVLVNPCPG